MNTIKNKPFIILFIFMGGVIFSNYSVASAEDEPPRKFLKNNLSQKVATQIAETENNSEDDMMVDLPVEGSDGDSSFTSTTLIPYSRKGFSGEEERFSGSASLMTHQQNFMIETMNLAKSASLREGTLEQDKEGKWHQILLKKVNSEQQGETIADMTLTVTNFCEEFFKEAGWDYNDERLKAYQKLSIWVKRGEEERDTGKFKTSEEERSYIPHSTFLEPIGEPFLINEKFHQQFKPTKKYKRPDKSDYVWEDPSIVKPLTLRHVKFDHNLSIGKSFQIVDTFTEYEKVLYEGIKNYKINQFYEHQRKFLKWENSNTKILQIYIDPQGAISYENINEQDKIIGQEKLIFSRWSHNDEELQSHKIYLVQESGEEREASEERKKYDFKSNDLSPEGDPQLRDEAPYEQIFKIIKNYIRPGGSEYQRTQKAPLPLDLEHYSFFHDIAAGKSYQIVNGFTNYESKRYQGLQNYKVKYRPYHHLKGGFLYWRDEKKDHVSTPFYQLYIDPAGAFTQDRIMQEQKIVGEIRGEEVLHEKIKASFLGGMIGRKGKYRIPHNTHEYECTFHENCP